MRELAAREKKFDVVVDQFGAGTGGTPTAEADGKAVLTAADFRIQIVARWQTDTQQLRCALFQVILKQAVLGHMARTRGALSG